jgi:WD40 repeat protein
MIRFSPFKKNILVSGGNDGTVCVWDVNNNKTISRFEKEHASRVSALSFSTFN